MFVKRGNDKLIKQISKHISQYISLNEEYISLIILSIIVFLIANILKRIVIKFLKLIKDNYKEYSITRSFKIFISLIEWGIIIIIWEEHIKNIITLVSFVSAAIAFSLRDIILNFFSGIYIKIKRPFQIEDRIQINDLKGDVINITSMNFEVLEINDEHGGQSSGIIITFPNSTIFSNPVKNYNKAFKYIWDEITVLIPIECDLKQIKSELYKIVNNNQIIKAIPSKMKNQINGIGTDYRIYFNKFDPIIYTKVNKDHIELSIRFLIHPKKTRYVESQLWNKILIAQKEGKITLYKGDD